MQETAFLLFLLFDSRKNSRKQYPAPMVLRTDLVGCAGRGSFPYAAFVNLDSIVVYRFGDLVKDESGEVFA